MKKLMLLVAAFLCFAATADAQPVYDKPVYDPASKSYFELVKVTRPMSPGLAIPSLPYDKAAVAAAGRAFKGAPGRLAIVRSVETHLFILHNLRPREETWIGLRYLCKTHELKWVNGESLVKNQFQAWHAQWDQSGNAGCVNQRGETDWMPVAYTAAGKGFRWVAKGGKKIYVAFLVEYPTGRP
jgi:hypothetical protein